MTKIRCIAVDDEPLALAQLEKQLQRQPDVEVLATCLSAAQARRALAQHAAEVDVLLLDIDMPDTDGIAFAQQLTPPAPYIIFTTAYPQYAAEGFRLNAVDYLLKPLSPTELREALDRVLRRRRADHPNEGAEQILYVRADGATQRVPYSNILYIKGMSEYVQIVRNDGKPLVTLQSMKRLEALLADAGFVRIHKSYIVNLRAVTSLGNATVAISGHGTLPVGDTYRSSLMQKLQQI